jgi:acyl-CoA thioesterase FadM
LLASFETWFCELFGEEAWSQTGQMAAKFVNPARIGDTVTLEIVVGEKQGERVQFEVRVLHDDRLLALGSASLKLQ